MTERNFKRKYLSYLKGLVCDQTRTGLEYSKVFEALFDIEFYAIGKLTELDGNRMGDAIELRVNYERDNGYLRPVMLGPPTVLEVMVALAVRCEDCIMGNYDYGNRTGVWFWYMIESMGLIPYTDDCFNKDNVYAIIFRMLDRKYSEDGRGGLFYIPDCRHDLRHVEIWYQMNWWLNTIDD